MSSAIRVSTASTRLVRLVLATLLTMLVVVLTGATALLGCSSSSGPGASGTDAGSDVVTTSDGPTTTDVVTHDSAADVVPGDGAKSDAGIAVTVMGQAGPLSTQQERDFFATVTGTTNTAVTWSVVEAQGGAVTATGQYTSPATAGTYHVMATSQADPAASGQVTVDVVAAPIATLTAPAVVTTAATGLSASVPTQSGVMYAWTMTGGTITAGLGTNAITFTAGAPGTLVVTCVVTNAAGVAATGTANIVVSATAVVSISAPSIVTTAATGLMASVPSQAGATFAWTITNGTITAGGATNAMTFTAGAVGALTLGCTVTVGGTPALGVANVSVVAAPVAVITAPASAGVNATGLAASVPTQAGAKYTWSISGGTITAGAGTAAITFSAGSAGTLTLTVTVTNTAGTAATGTANVAVVSAPTTTIITAPGQATTGTTGLVASIAAQAGSTYAWTITGGTITSAADGASIVFTAGAVGTLTLSVTVTNAAGTASASATVLVVAGAVVSINAPSAAASGTPGLVATVPAQSGATYVWTITDGTITAGQGTASITFTAGAAGALTLGCTVTVASVPTSGSATVTVLDMPTTPTITGPSQATTGTTGLVASVTPQTGVTYAWTITGGTITSAANTASIVFTAGAVGTLTLSVSVSNAVGIANASDDVDIVATPVVPITAPSTAVTGTAGLVATVTAVSGDTYVWTITGGTITAGQGTSAITFTAGAVGTLTLGVTLTDGSGNATTGTGTVNVVSATASLTVFISGIPANGSVTVTGPNSFSSIINATQTLSGLAPGVYVVTAPPFVLAGLTYTAVVVGSPVTLGVNIGTVTVTYTAFDNPPTVSAIAAQTVYTNNSITVPFTIGDAEDALSALVLTAGQVPAGVVTSSFGGSGANRTLTLTGGGTAGATQFTVTVTDTQGKTATTTFTVTVPSATVTVLTDSGAGSLRAILAAVPAGIIVTFDPSLNSMAIGLSSAITISQNQTIQGPGAALLTVSGGAGTQLLVISSGTVAMSGLTLTGGAHAGGTSNGGAIDNEGTLTVTSCTFSSNTTGQYGGAIFNGDTHTLTVTGSTFTSNTAFNVGGGLFNGSGTMTVTGSTFTSNNSAGNGAAVFNDGTLVVSGSTFSLNTATNQGGGIFNDATATVTNSTFTANSGVGAALADNGAATLVSVTVSGNTGGAALYQSGGAATVQFQNSVISANPGGDLSGTFTSGGYNLIGSTAGATITLAGTDITNPSPGLGALGSNGGPTKTMVPVAGGPAVNVIPVASCVDAAGQPLTVDQRGSPRPGVGGTKCSIGAVERQTGDP